MTETMWTETRLALLAQKRKGEGLPYGEILPLLNVLPGAKIKRVGSVIRAFHNRKNILKTKKPAGISPAAGGTRAKQPSVAIKVPPQMTAAPNLVVLPYQTVLAWARSAGLIGKYEGLNLVKVNLWCKRNGLPQIKIEGSQ